MTPQAQRIVVAETCGWVWRDGQEPCYGGTYLPAGWTAPNGDFYESDWHAKSAFRLPDYSSDLNAMHEAEKVLTDEQFSRYGWTLLQREPNIECRAFLSATAAQRAEAFLRTLNLWDDTK